MRVAFIACEYNPIHNGHKYHIEQTKKLNVDAVICVMSGNFVQRGDIAVAEKHLRAESALMCGADIVLELPLKYAVSTASYFAEGFMRTISGLGLKGVVSCGALSPLDELRLMQNICFSDDAEDYAKIKLSEGINYPRAKSMFLSNVLGEEYAEKFSEPNNILALEYLEAANKYFPEVDFHIVQRIGASHDSDFTTENFSSASNIRKILYDNNNILTALEKCNAYIPNEVIELFASASEYGNFPVSKERFDVAAMSRLLNAQIGDFSVINNVNGGLDNRIYKCIKLSTSVNEIADRAKSKVHTHSRIRQILLNTVLGIKKDDLQTPPSYIRVLGFNDIGRNVLGLIRKTAKVPVVCNLSELDSANFAVAREIELDYSAGKFFQLCINQPLFANPEFDIPPVYKIL